MTATTPLEHIAQEGARDGIFHIAEADAWHAAQASGSYAPPSLRAEGFIHCSMRSQVLDTAARFYAGRADLWLLRIDAEAVANALRYEGPMPPSPELRHALFPHLYAALPVTAVRGAAPLRGDGEGAFAWPKDPQFE